MIDLFEHRAPASVKATLQYIAENIIKEHLAAYCLVLALACLVGLAIIH